MREALAKGISLGLTFIDTALATGEGQSEKMLKEEPGIQGHDLQAGAPAHSAPRKDMTHAPDRQPDAQ